MDLDANIFRRFAERDAEEPVLREMVAAKCAMPAEWRRHAGDV